MSDGVVGWRNHIIDLDVFLEKGKKGGMYLNIFTSQGCQSTAFLFSPLADQFNF
jgi:hypothetical protein